MSIETINNGETGLVVRGKINDNFAEVDSAITANEDFSQSNSESIQDLTGELAAITCFPITTNKMIGYSESILGVGSFYEQFITELKTTPNYFSKQSYGGSHIGVALAQEASTIQGFTTEDNQLINSNDITITSDPGWSAVETGVTYSKVYLSDGTLWNEVEKQTSDTGKELKQKNISVTANPVGTYISFELDLPTEEFMTSFYLNVINITTGGTFTKIYGNGFSGYDFVGGEREQISLTVSKDDLPISVGDSITIRIDLNKGGDDLPCVARFRNFITSFTSNISQKYIETSTTVIAPSTKAWNDIKKNIYKYNFIDAIITSFGRNEANSNVSAKSHYRAYDALCNALSKRAESFVIGNPPPKANVALTEWEDLDDYDTYITYFNKLQAKWNSGIDVFTLFKTLTENGTYSISDLMIDPYHPTDIGGRVMSVQYANELESGRKNTNFAMAELENEIKYYCGGSPTGSWEIVDVDNSINNDMFGSEVALQTSVLGDTLEYPSVKFEQVHVIYGEHEDNGEITVIIDEDEVYERKFVVDTSLVGITTERCHSEFICDYLDNTIEHTVKIEITSSGNNVTIHGVVLI